MDSDDVLSHLLRLNKWHLSILVSRVARDFDTEAHSLLRPWLICVVRFRLLDGRRNTARCRFLCFVNDDPLGLQQQLVYRTLFQMVQDIVKQVQNTTVTYSVCFTSLRAQVWLVVL